MENSAAPLSKRDYWLLEMNHIHAAHRADETEVQSKRWFDYRRMTGAEATYLFAEHYRHQYLESYKQTKDIRTVDSIAPFAPADIFESNDLTSMWLARQAADSICCKYGFYLHHVFNVFTTRGWQNLPRPNQIYSEELVMSVNTAWQKRCSEILQIAEHEFFSAPSYISHPDQLDYYEWLIAHIKMRENKHIAISGLLERNILPKEIVIESFGLEVYKRALMF